MLGIVAAPVVEARVLLFGLGMLLVEILGKNWWHNAILAVLTLVLVAGPIFCLELSTPGISSGFWWTASAAAKFGISVAILCTSVHNVASGRHVVKGIIGLIVFFPLWMCSMLPSVR